MAVGTQCIHGDYDVATSPLVFVECAIHHEQEVREE